MDRKNKNLGYKKLTLKDDFLKRTDVGKENKKMNIFAQIIEIIFVYGIVAGVIGTVFVEIIITIIVLLIKMYKGSENNENRI